MGFWRGSGCALYVATISNPGAPTASEMAAGVDLSMGITSFEGFIATVNRIGVPLLGSAVDAQVNGASSFTDSNIGLIEDNGVGSNADDVARRLAISTLVPGATGYIVVSLFKKKAQLTAASKVDVFAGYVAAANKQFSMDSSVARRQVSWIQTADPRQDATVAA